MKKVSLGLVPYLNACPLRHGLAENPSVRIHTVRPSELAALLDDGAVDAALVPVVDYWPRRDQWELAVPLGICSDGPVWTVKIFSHVPIERIDQLTVDSDSHTSINLARVLIHRLTGNQPTLITKRFNTHLKTITANEGPTLLIGDKAWQVKHADYMYDLGQIWREHVGLPFVYAVWVSRKHALPDEMKNLLISTADRNFQQIDALAAIYGPRHGFAIPDAQRYLSEIIRYPVGPEQWAGLEHFANALDALTGQPA